MLNQTVLGKVFTLVKNDIKLFPNRLYFFKYAYSSW